MFLVLCGSTRAELAEKVAARMEKSTVRVVIFKGDKVMGHGSGFIISSQGHVATNRHVIAEAERAVAVYAQGDKVYFRAATFVAASNTADLAILKIDPIPSTEVVQISTANLVTGQTVMTVGFPGVIDSMAWYTGKGVEFGTKSDEGRITDPNAAGDFVPAIFSGTVAKIETRSDTRCVLHSAKISHGNSGGPLVDADGRVCGINTWNVYGSEASGAAGADYPISIHASELVSLAHAHSIPINVTSSKSSNGSGTNLPTPLLAAAAAFAVVLFLLVLRKPRMVMVDAMSRVVRSKPAASGQAAYRVSAPATIPAQASPRASSNGGKLRLRGRDLQGISYDIAFNNEDFGRCGNRLVIGRNQDLSQLHLAHDSVSRQHATLSWQGGEIHVEDRNSGNGTKLNGRELIVGSPPAPLRSGDKLTLGEVDLMFEILN